MNEKTKTLWLGGAILALYNNNIPVSAARMAVLSNLLLLSDTEGKTMISYRKLSEITGVAYGSISTAVSDFEKIGAITKKEQLSEDGVKRGKGSLPQVIAFVPDIIESEYSEQELHWLSIAASVLASYEKIGSARISLLLYLLKNINKLSKEVYWFDDIAKDSKIAYATVATAMKTLITHGCLNKKKDLYTLKMKCDGDIQMIAYKYMSKKG
ncbi:MAG: Unknown protein [uncultured Sulfurovum sp.]|uniref:Plasmid replication protein RepL domain-containing protein n=1 Tax=uncultured Sulfurovum sp. TaxID=269237 RepID=A0A6S6SGI6_9BACT|nr:MAG: Unknown protein [uncultured Sulfurovum sp.]